MREDSYAWVILPLAAIFFVIAVFLIFGGGGASGASQANVEYFFRLLYDCFTGSCAPGGFGSLLTSLWVWIAIIGYILAFIALCVVAYCTFQIFELRKREQVIYGQIHVAEDENAGNPRWQHIQGLMGSLNANDWRQAIIEADIMLGDTLTRLGYRGASIGDQLQQVDRPDFDALQDAWDAHKIRNDIAHQGSTFDLSQTLAQRTIAKYEKVFRELEAI